MGFIATIIFDFVVFIFNKKLLNFEKKRIFCLPTIYRRIWPMKNGGSSWTRIPCQSIRDLLGDFPPFLPRKLAGRPQTWLEQCQACFFGVWNVKYNLIRSLINVSYFFFIYPKEGHFDFKMYCLEKMAFISPLAKPLLVLEQIVYKKL